MEEDIGQSDFVQRAPYVATVGKYCRIPIEVFSEGLGHASVTTTEGYMKGVGNNRMEQANKVIMNYIFNG